MSRSALLALTAGLATLACTSDEPGACPGTPVATFRFEGALVAAVPDDPDDPAEGLLDCTPDPLDPAAPIRYREALPPFDATLSSDPAGPTAALCRSNGVVLSGERTGPSSYSVETSSDGAVLCSSTCSATLRLVVAGDVVPDPGGGAATFEGILVEVLTEARGACDACLPLVPDADPPERACAARYALSGTPL